MIQIVGFEEFEKNDRLIADKWQSFYHSGFANSSRNIFNEHASNNRYLLLDNLKTLRKNGCDEKGSSFIDHNDIRLWMNKIKELFKTDYECNIVVLTKIFRNLVNNNNHYGIGKCIDGVYGQEPGAVILDHNNLDKDDYMSVVVHEMAHAYIYRCWASGRSESDNERKMLLNEAGAIYLEKAVAGEGIQERIIKSIIDSFKPALVEDSRKIVGSDPPSEKSRHCAIEDILDRYIAYLQEHKLSFPNKSKLRYLLAENIAKASDLDSIRKNYGAVTST